MKNGCDGVSVGLGGTGVNWAAASVHTAGRRLANILIGRPLMLGLTRRAALVLPFLINPCPEKIPGVRCTIGFPTASEWRKQSQDSKDERSFCYGCAATERNRQGFGVRRQGASRHG